MKQTTPEVHSYFDQTTNAACYIVKDPSSSACAIIDSIWDFDMASGRTHTAHADMLIDKITKNGWTLEWVIETHVHADHLSAAPYIVQQMGGKIAIGSNIDRVQKVFGKVFNAGTEFQMDGSQFDRLFEDGDHFKIGNMDVEVMHTPGHTPACVTYVVGNSAFIGDTLFMPDYGTARCDFPGGDATTLFESMETILSLPDDTRLFMCHDYAPGGREYLWESTVAASKASNIHLAGKTKAEFIDMRTTRDAQLSAPRLLLPSVQVNMRAGHMPPAEDNGIAYIKIPVNQIGA